MKSALSRFFTGLIISLSCMIATPVNADMTVPSGPITVGAAVPPIVMLDITKDQNLYQKAYNDYSDLDADGYIETTYKHTIDYYGYFDSYKCYTYINSRFEPVSRANYLTKPSDCSGAWHGNFLNWATMSRMDAVRKLLYGGLRSTDGTGAAGITVLERAYIPTDAHAWAKYYNPVIAQAMDTKPLTASETWVQRYPLLNQLTPYNPTTTPTALTSITSNNIGTGKKVFALSSTTGFSIGDQVLITDANDASNYMVGAVGCVNGTGANLYNGIAAATNSCAAGEIAVAVEAIGGSGTKTDWRISNWTQTGMTICNATLGAASGDDMKSQTNTQPPLMRVALGNFSMWTANERWQCAWREERSGDLSSVGGSANNGNRAALSGSYASTIGPNKTTSRSGRVTNGAAGADSDFNVRVKACVSTALEGREKCANYPDGNLKPIGLVQFYGEKGLLRFGLMTGSYTKNKSGGVLRKNVGDLADEINTTTDGSFKTPTGGSIINTLNLMRMYGYSYNDGKYDADGTNGSTFCSWGETTLTEGNCLSWGNPMSEIYLESLRYLAGKTATPAFNTTDDSDRIAGLTTATWSNPISSANYCAPLNTLVFNASASSYDTDQMAGASDINSGDALAKTNTLGTEQGITSGYIGNNGTINNDICSNKSITSLGTAFGICPEGAGLEGGYLMSGLAYHARTNRIRTDLTVPETDTRSLKVTTYGISLASNVPRVTVPVGTGSVTIMPAGRLDAGNNKFGGGAIVDFKIICQIPLDASDETLTSIRTTSGRICNEKGSGAFYVNWEDSEQGGDYDQDMWGRIKYQINANNTITITSDVVAQSTPIKFGFGYAVSGTNKDGPHFHSGINGFAYTDPNTITVTGGDTSSIGTSGGCSNCTSGLAATSATYEAATTTPSTLQDPMWYAAKFGGFKERDGAVNNKPDLTYEWDAKRADGTAGQDGTPDNYFLVTNPAYLEESLDKAFSAMLNESSSSAVATNSTSLQTGSRIYQARFNTNYWYGEVRALNLDPTTGNVSTEEAWNAKDKIPASRNIITYGLDAKDGIPFTWSAISAQTDTTQKDWLNKNESGVADPTASPLGSSRLDYLRGSSANEGKSATNFRERPETKLGDIINSSPVYVGKPEAGWAGAAYLAFRTAHVNRSPMIYAGANDGMLHAFDISDGTEKLAFVPSAVYPNLTKLTGQSYAHKFFVDGTPMVNDIQVGSGTTETWKTVLTGGLNWGGRGFYALDITDPSTFTENNAANIVMWEFTNANDSDLGYTLVQPTYPPFKSTSQQIARMYNGKWALIVNNGYNSDNGKAALFIFFLDRTTGSTWTLGTDYIKLVADAGPNNGLSTPMPFDVDDDGVIDFVYAGDVKGNLWKFDVTHADPANWKVAFNTASCMREAPCTPLYVAQDAATPTPNRQPITTAPMAMRHPLGGVMVTFGTGKYLENSDTTSNRQQSFYGVWDKDGETVVTGRGQLVQQTLLETQVITETAGAQRKNDFRITSKNFNTAIGWTTDDKKGWYLDFPAPSPTTNPGERIAYNPLLRNDRIVFPTLIPSNTPCIAGGDSWLMELDALTGNRLDIAPFDVNGDGLVNAADLLTLADGTKVAASAIKPGEGGIFTTPTVIKSKDPRLENKYPSSSTGAIIKISEGVNPDKAGRITWREIIQ